MQSFWLGGLRRVCARWVCVFCWEELQSNLTADVIMYELHKDYCAELLFALWQPSSGLHFTYFHEVIIRRPGTSLSKCPHNHMWNTLVSTCVCVGQTELGEWSRRKGKREGGESGSNLIWTTFEMEEEVCLTSKRPVWGEWNVQPANEAAVCEKAGGLTEVCQLHNEAPPCS